MHVHACHCTDQSEFDTMSPYKRPSSYNHQQSWSTQ